MAGSTQRLTWSSPSASPLRSEGKAGMAPQVVEGGRSQQQSLWLAAFLVYAEQQAHQPLRLLALASLCPGEVSRGSSS